MRSETKPSQDEEKNGQEPLLPPIQPVIDFGSVVIKNSRAAIHCLTIAGQIEGHMQLPNTQKATKYEHVLPLLAYLEESEDIDGVLFLLNTVGGDVEAGGAPAPRSARSCAAGDTPSACRCCCADGDDDRAVGVDDHPSRAHERHDHRRAPDVPVF